MQLRSIKKTLTLNCPETEIIKEIKWILVYVLEITSYITCFKKIKKMIELIFLRLCLISNCGQVSITKTTKRQKSFFKLIKRNSVKLSKAMTFCQAQMDVAFMPRCLSCSMIIVIFTMGLGAHNRPITGLVKTHIAALHICIYL